MKNKKFVGVLVSVGVLASLLFGLGEGVFSSDYTLGYEQSGEPKVSDIFQLAHGGRAATRCEWYDRGEYYIIKRDCITANMFPRLTLQEAVDALVPHIHDAEKFYEFSASQFSYEGTDLIFDPAFIAERDEWEMSILNMPKEEQQADEFIYPKSFLAMYQLDNLTVYASVRDTSTYGTCRRQNYDVAMNQMDRYFLEPGDVLNMNRIIANQPGYCRGDGGTFLFYEGACGASTQVFWNALLNPLLTVTKRYPHGHRYAGFYGSAVMGDDASMYERGKQLELKNTSDLPIYFRTFNREDGNTVLLSFVDKQIGLSSMIIKQQTGKLTSVLTNLVFDENGNIVNEYEWQSRYWGIDTTVDLPQ